MDTAYNLLIYALKDKFGVGMIHVKIQDNTAMNGVRYFLPLFFVFSMKLCIQLCDRREITYSIQRPIVFWALKSLIASLSCALARR